MDFICPMRFNLPMACSFTSRSKPGSKNTSVSPSVKLIPTSATFVDRKNTFDFHPNYSKNGFLEYSRAHF